MAVEDFGGKVLGKPIEVLVADHQNKPDTASALACKWFDVDKVDMVANLIIPRSRSAFPNSQKRRTGSPSSTAQVRHGSQTMPAHRTAFTMHTTPMLWLEVLGLHCSRQARRAGIFSPQITLLAMPWRQTPPPL
jgi:hypothetical protein